MPKTSSPLLTSSTASYDENYNRIPKQKPAVIGGKKSRKGSKKSRKGSRKSRKGSKKSRKGSKKSRK
jgi:hypothetical protein